MLSIAILSAGQSSYSQKTEIKVNAYSGLFFFRGSDAASTSVIHTGDAPMYWTDETFGKTPAFSYSVSLQAQRVTKQNHLFGLEIGWEELKSRTRVDTVTCNFCLPGHSVELVKGHETTATSFLNISPYVGQRWNAGKITLDLTAGVDLAVCTKVQDISRYALRNSSDYGGVKYNKRHPDLDVRPRLQINAYYNRIGVIAGYSLGLTNFQLIDNHAYYNREAFTNFLRLGVGYRLK